MEPASDELTPEKVAAAEHQSRGSVRERLAYLLNPKEVCAAVPLSASGVSTLPGPCAEFAAEAATTVEVLAGTPRELAGEKCGSDSSGDLSIPLEREERVCRARAVLGIVSTKCGSCGAVNALRNRAFVELGKLYCERCWSQWDRCGWWQPTLRVNTAPPRCGSSGRPEYGPEDCFFLPAFACAHDDFSLARRLREELPEGKDFGDWHGARHHALHVGGDEARQTNRACIPQAWQETVRRLEEAFDMTAAAIRLNLYRSTADYKPMHQDRGRDDEGVPQVSVGVSFGITRELVFQHIQTGLTMSFPQRNGDVFVFTPEVNNVFTHGVAKTRSVPPEGDGIRLSFVIWGPRNTCAYDEPARIEPELGNDEPVVAAQVVK